MTQLEVLAHVRRMIYLHNAGMSLKAKVMMHKAVKSLEADTEATCQ